MDQILGGVELHVQNFKTISQILNCKEYTPCGPLKGSTMLPSVYLLKITKEQKKMTRPGLGRH